MTPWLGCGKSLRIPSSGAQRLAADDQAIHARGRTVVAVVSHRAEQGAFGCVDRVLPRLHGLSGQHPDGVNLAQEGQALVAWLGSLRWPAHGGEQAADGQTAALALRVARQCPLPERKPLGSGQPKARLTGKGRGGRFRRQVERQQGVHAAGLDRSVGTLGRGRADDGQPAPKVALRPTESPAYARQRPSPRAAATWRRLEAEFFCTCSAKAGSIARYRCRVRPWPPLARTSKPGGWTSIARHPRHRGWPHSTELQDGRHALAALNSLGYDRLQFAVRAGPVSRLTELLAVV